MTVPNLRTVIVEYDDGTQASASYQSLTAQCRWELERQPAFRRPSPAPDKEKYLILTWEDGWREVHKVDAGCTDFNRYYVIARPEDVGRLSINKTDGYPELVEIGRRPLSLKSVALGGTWALVLDQTTREGKKTDHFFKMSPAADVITEMKRQFRQVLAEEKLTDEIDSLSPEKRIEEYEKIRKRMKLSAGFNQQDVIDFLAYLNKTSA